MSAELIRAGFDMVEADAPGKRIIYVPVDDWIDAAILSMLGRTERPTSLYTTDDQLVAWAGNRDPAQCEAKMVTQAPVFSIRYPWDLLKLNDSILRQITDSEVKGTVSHLAEIDGTLQLGSGSKILPGTFIEGNVVIGRNCRIGPNCHIRGTVSIGDHCSIGNGAEIKNSIIYPHSSVAHYGYVGDSILGAHVHLGAGTVISNARHDGMRHRSSVEGKLVDTGRYKFGTIIGDGVRTGVNTVILPGRKIGRGRTTRPGMIVETDLM